YLSSTPTCAIEVSSAPVLRRIIWLLLSKSLRMLNGVWRLFQRSNTDFEFAVDTLEAVSYYALRQHDTIIR
ncbi:MAG: hypothetical protein E7H57_05740, partial [Pantoea sp.]|nr:hypothetical protein [Pantoea sp.]